MEFDGKKYQEIIRELLDTLGDLMKAYGEDTIGAIFKALAKITSGGTLEIIRKLIEDFLEVRKYSLQTSSQYIRQDGLGTAWKRYRRKRVELY